MKKTIERLKKAQSRYKSTYDTHLRKHAEVNKVDDYLYLRIERSDPNEHRHKLAPVAKGP